MIVSSSQQKIYRFFLNNLGKALTSSLLHHQFGSAFRTRVSEINKARHPMKIVNSMATGESMYWGEPRGRGNHNS